MADFTHAEDTPFFRQVIALIDQSTKLPKDDRIALRNYLKDYLRQLRENRNNEDDHEHVQQLIQIFIETNKKRSLSKIKKGDPLMDNMQIKLRKFMETLKKEKHRLEIQTFRKNNQSSQTHSSSIKIVERSQIPHRPANNSQRQSSNNKIYQQLQKPTFKDAQIRSPLANHNITADKKEPKRLGSKSQSKDSSFVKPTPTKQSYYNMSYHQTYEEFRKKPQIGISNLTSYKNSKFTNSHKQKTSGRKHSQIKALNSSFEERQNSLRHKTSANRPNKTNRQIFDTQKARQLTDDFTQHLHAEKPQNNQPSFTFYPYPTQAPFKPQKISATVVKPQQKKQFFQQSPLHQYSVPHQQSLQHQHSLEQQYNAQHQQSVSQYQNSVQNHQLISYWNQENSIENQPSQEESIQGNRTFEKYEASTKKIQELFENSRNLLASYGFSNDPPTFSHQPATQFNAIKQNTDDIFTSPELMAQCKVFMSHSSRKSQLALAQAQPDPNSSPQPLTFSGILRSSREPKQFSPSHISKVEQLVANQVCSEGPSLNISSSKPTQVQRLLNPISFFTLQDLLVNIFEQPRISLTSQQLQQILNKTAYEPRKSFQKYIQALKRQYGEDDSYFYFDFVALVKFFNNSGLLSDNKHQFSTLLCDILDIRGKGYIDQNDIQVFLESLQSSQIQEQSLLRIRDLLWMVFGRGCEIEGAPLLTRWGIYYLELFECDEIEKLQEELNQFQFHIDHQ